MARIRWAFWGTLLALAFAAGWGCARSPERSAPAAAPTVVRPEPPDVAALGPGDAVAFFRGALDGYPDVGPEDLNDASAANILETFDNVLLDRLTEQGGQQSLARVYDVIATAVLDTLVSVYPDGDVVLALDAGHGGVPGFEGGADGSEWRHTRQAATAIERLAGDDARYQRIVVRRVWNDAIPSDFRLPPALTRDITSQLLLRQTRVAVLARWARDWNTAHPESPVVVHEISVHFNLNAGVSLVLHQGSAVRPEFAARSVAFAKGYLARVVPALDETGLLGEPLRLYAGVGLHDDVMMWAPEYAAGDQAVDGVSRYAVLQAAPSLRRYLEQVLAAWL